MKHFDWSPGIGDPTMLGWLTVLLYLAASLLCWRVASDLIGARAGKTRESRIWRYISALCLALGLNKQLDLQSGLTEAFGVLAYNQGWYNQRQTVQLIFILGVAVLSLVAAIVMIRWARQSLQATRLALIGAIMLLCFVFMRAASFHHFDHYVDQRLLGVKWSWLLEIGGIALVLAGSLRVLLGERAADSAKSAQIAA